MIYYILCNVKYRTTGGSIMASASGRKTTKGRTNTKSKGKKRTARKDVDIAVKNEVVLMSYGGHGDRQHHASGQGGRSSGRPLGHAPHHRQLHPDNHLRAKELVHNHEDSCSKINLRILQIIN